MFKGNKIIKVIKMVVSALLWWKLGGFSSLYRPLLAMFKGNTIIKVIKIQNVVV
jgi:hypothetical protein